MEDQDMEETTDSDEDSTQLNDMKAVVKSSYDFASERSIKYDLNVDRGEPNKLMKISAVKRKNSSISIDKGEMQIEGPMIITIGKRRRADDIYKIKQKKSSLHPDLPINATAILSDSLPKISSNSKIDNLPEKPINRGAIPKVRDESIKKIPDTHNKAWNALMSEAQNAVPMEKLPMSEKLRPKIPMQENFKSEKKSTMNKKSHVEQTTTTVNVKSEPSKSNITESVKLEPSADIGMQPKSVSPSVNFNNQQKPEELAGPIHQRSQTQTVNRPKQTASKTAPLAAGSIKQEEPTQTINRKQNQWQFDLPYDPANRPYFITTTIEIDNMELQVKVPLRRAARAKEQKPTQTINRAQKSQPTTASQAAGSINQHRQTQTKNRTEQSQPTTATLAAATINQQNPTQWIYRTDKRQPTTARLAAGSIKKERLIDMENDEAQQQYYLPRQIKSEHLEQDDLQFQEAPMQHAAPANEQITKRIICKEMYYKLRNIFPNVDRKYIKKLCPPDWSPGNKDDQMALIIEHLLAAGETLPQELLMDDKTKQIRNNVSYKNADDLYEFLIGIFPDADPHYLREIAVEKFGKDDAIKNFVDLNLDRREYPTREQYIAQLKITEQQNQYTTEFDVKQFLSIIPDPFKHFMDVQRKCRYQKEALEFLKCHFNKHRASTVSRVYDRSFYILSIAARNLESLPIELKRYRWNYEIDTEDISLLQEIAFIKHKEAINEYIEQMKKREDEEFKTLKAMNQLLECQCCFDSECVPSKCSECDNGHIFCNSCIITGTSAKMGEDQTRIYCFINCGSEFSLSVLQQVLGPTTFSVLLKKRQAAEVIEAGLEGLVSCPFCHFASIPPEGDKIFKCLNPECTKESCRLCKELSHVPLKCEEVIKNDNARRYIEEKMTQALARKCYKCQRAFFKEEGCNKITCPCGAQMCYLCDQPIKDYTHFRGQGSDNKDLCPLYTDTMRLDAVAVRKVAEEAQREMLQRNPNIHIDTTGLLPDIPLPRYGPHNYVLNADELPRRAQRGLDLPPL